MTESAWDVVIVGAGPAGMAAACAAASSGATVAVLDDNHTPGGQIWRRGAGGSQTQDALYKTATREFEESHVTLLSRRRVISADENQTLTCWRDDVNRRETIRYTRLILATGARERFLPFPGWTLPGVFGVGGLQALVSGGFDVTGKRVIVAGTGPLMLPVAAHLLHDGAHVAGVYEQASLPQLLPFTLQLLRHPGKLVQGAQLMLQLRRVPYRTGTWIKSAQGKHKVESVILTDGARTWSEPCDLLACSYHLVANTELAALLGCEIRNGVVAVDAMQRTSKPDIFCAGEPTGIAGVDAATHTGRVAGCAAAGNVTGASKLLPGSEAHRAFGKAMDRAFRPRPEVLRLATDDTVVCRCEDTRYRTLQNISSTSGSWTDAKLQTRCGMGPCQGRICGPAVEALFGWKNQSVRAPIFPVPLEALCDQSPLLQTQSDVAQETR